MKEHIFFYLDLFDDYLWSYLGVPIIVLLGIYLSYQSRLVQIRRFPKVCQTFWSLLKSKAERDGTVHPIKAFFAAVGGCVGIGNIVGVCTAIQIGGPGALIWIWVTATAGMIIKYSEVYLGMRYRVGNGEKGYRGGPMYFLQHAFKSAWVPKLVCLCLCIYGIEVYQFKVVVESITENFAYNEYGIIAVLLFLVLFAGSGGVERVGNISSAIIPIFVIIYTGMGMWVLIANFWLIPSILKDVIVSAFSGHAALGGFVGSALVMTMSQGVRRGCYTGDVGVGYASVIHSESSEQVAEKQASLAILGIFLDTFVVCSTTILVILATGVWAEPIPTALLVQTALSKYFDHMDFFMPLFLFLLGYSTINAYFIVGLTCAEYLSPRWGKTCFYSYGIMALITFSLVDTSHAMTVMSLTLVSLLIINSIGIFRLRHKVSYALDYPL